MRFLLQPIALVSVLLLALLGGSLAVEGMSTTGTIGVAVPPMPCPVTPRPTRTPLVSAHSQPGFHAEGPVQVCVTPVRPTPSPTPVTTPSPTPVVTQHAGCPGPVTPRLTRRPPGPTPTPTSTPVPVVCTPTPSPVRAEAIDDENGVDADTLAIGNVLANDQNLVADPSNLVEVNGSAGNVNTQITLASGALLRINANGDYSYDPNGAFTYLALGQSALDSATYTIEDASSHTSMATLSITVDGVNDPPVAVRDNYDTQAGQSLLGNLLVNDSDPDGDLIAVASVTGTAVVTPVSGTIVATTTGGSVVTVQTNGSFSYVPAASYLTLTIGQSQVDTFSYVVTDIHGALSNPAPVSVTIHGTAICSVGPITAEGVIASC